MRRRLSVKMLLCFFTGAGLSCSAQDIHFSQFYAAPLISTAVNTNYYDSDWRVLTNYRSQWKEIDKPYTTQAVGLDKTFYIHNDEFSSGFTVVDDRSAGTLKVNKFLLSLGYHKAIGADVLHIGIQPGYVMKSIGNRETFPNQMNWNTGRFDSSLPNNEANLVYKLSYFDLNLGIGYSKRIGAVRLSASVSTFHVTRPNETFTAYNNRLPVKTVFSSGAIWYAFPKITFQPLVMLSGTGKSSECLFGSNFWYALDKDYSIRSAMMLGAYTRYGYKNMNDAVVVSCGLNQRQFFAGISYDINISDLKVATSYRGAFEASLIYAGLGVSTKKRNVKVL